MVEIERVSDDGDDAVVGEEPFARADANENGGGDDRQSDEDEPCYCSFAVTGKALTFQAIFICRDCHPPQEEDQPLCICQSCAEACHDAHDVDYVGMGKAYCDCDQIGNCQLYSESKALAKQWNITSIADPDVLVEEQESKRDEKPADDDANKIRMEDDTDVLTGSSSPESPSYIQDAYTISDLMEGSNSDLGGAELEYLVQSARELVSHTKDTHWIGADADTAELHPLEHLALQIYKRHVHHYNLSASQHAGAEWWVQVKESKSDSTSAAIDLHYDKDEALAETFGIGAFPTLSTVTYLTPSQTSSPTVVFPHTYSDGEEEVMPYMWLSRPDVGKHIVFTGTLLHGAPSNRFLRPMEDIQSYQRDDMETDVSEERLSRVTFLVNLWMDRRPSKVDPLSLEIRSKLPQPEEPTLWIKDETIIDTFMTPRKISDVTIEEESDLPKELQKRIELPFVTKGITWAEDQDEDEDDEGLVVITFPPPPIKEADSILVKFGPGMQAYLDYKQEEEEVDDDEKQEDGSSASRGNTSHHQDPCTTYI